MSEEAEQFVILSSQVNPRSTSGRLADSGDANGASLYYKKGDPAVIEREAAELIRAATVAPGLSGITSVRYRASDPLHGLLVMYAVDGAESLFNVLWNGTQWWRFRRLSPSLAASIGTRLGQWLRAYHASSSRLESDLTDYLPPIVTPMYGRLAAMENMAEPFLEASTRARIRDYLATVERQFHAWGPLEVATLHGDMDASNVVMNSAGKLFVLDFADTRLGLAWEDLARFWHGLWSLSQLSPWRARLLSPCISALLAAYGGNPIGKHPLFTLLHCHNALIAVFVYANFGNRLGWSGGRACRQLAKVSRHWLNSFTW